MKEKAEFNQQILVSFRDENLTFFSLDLDPAQLIKKKIGFGPGLTPDPTLNRNKKK